jgi:hypothetical protein
MPDTWLFVFPLQLAAQSKKPVDITAQLAMRDPGVCALESLWW